MVTSLVGSPKKQRAEPSTFDNSVSGSNTSAKMINLKETPKIGGTKGSTVKSNALNQQIKNQRTHNMRNSNITNTYKQSS